MQLLFLQTVEENHLSSRVEQEFKELLFDHHGIFAKSSTSVRLQLYGAGDPTPTQLAEDTDETLFCRITRNQHHVLHRFLPELNCHQHILRPRRHNFSLSVKTDDWNFIIRQLFSNSY